MRMLECSSLGIDDGFVVKGDTEEEVMNQMIEHIKIAHPEKMADMATPEMMAMVRSNIHDA